MSLHKASSGRTQANDKIEGLLLKQRTQIICECLFGVLACKPCRDQGVISDVDRPGGSLSQLDPKSLWSIHSKV